MPRRSTLFALTATFCFTSILFLSSGSAARLERTHREKQRSDLPETINSVAQQKGGARFVAQEEELNKSRKSRKRKERTPTLIQPARGCWSEGVRSIRKPLRK